MPLILRLEKGSPLTYQEMDANLTYLFSASINDTGSEIFSGSLTVTGSLKVTGSTAINGTWVLTGSAVTSGSLKVLGNINNSGSIYITTDTLTTFVPSIVVTSSVDGFNTLELYNNANQGYSATALTLKNNLLDKSHIIVPGEYYGYGWFDNDSITGSLVLHSNKDVVFIASGSTFPKSGEETLRIQKNRVIISGSLTVTGTTTVLSSSIITGSLTVTGSENVIGNAFITGSLILTGSFIQTGSLYLSGSALIGPYAANTTALAGISVGYNGASGIMHFGRFGATSNAIWGYHTDTPTVTNYNLNFDANNAYFNSLANVFLVTNGTIRFAFGTTTSYNTLSFRVGSNITPTSTLDVSGNGCISGSLIVSGSNQIIGTTQVTGSFEVSGSVVLASNTANTVFIGNGNFGFTNVVFNAAGNANGFSITRVTATTTAPCYVINRADTTTGIGGAIGTVGLIVSGSSVLTVSSSYVGATGSIQLSGSVGISGSLIIDEPGGSNTFRVRRQGGAVEGILSSQSGGVFIGASTNNSLTLQAGGVAYTTLSTTGDISHAKSISISGSTIVSGSLSVNPSGSFTLPTTASFITPQTGSMFFSGSYIWVHNGVRWMSASLA